MLSKFKYSFLFLVCCCLVSLSACDPPKTVPSETPVVDEGSSSTQDTEVSESSGAKDESGSGDSGSTDQEAQSSKKTESATEVTNGFDVTVADGALTLKAPATWESVKPRFNMIEAEIKIAKSEGEAEDERDGRLTVMGAMGSVEANINRWYGQYSQPDGGDTADAATVTQSKVNGLDVTWVDIKGTLLDRPGGPMAGGKVIERENYRTLAAIVQTGEFGQYFIKLYGPGKTIADQEEAFKSFVESVTINAEKEDL